MDASSPISLTMGEPSGIGGEITLKAWMQSDESCPFFVIDCPERLSALAQSVNVNVPITPISDPAECTQVFHKALPVLPLDHKVDSQPGKADPKNAAAVVESIERAFKYTKTGKARAMVTNPIQKESLYRANFSHPGHTEYLAHLDGPGVTPVMMLASPMLRVVPVTVHMSIQSALSSLTMDMIFEKARITIEALIKDFGIPRPRISIAGLNPHAGENGTLGEEEITIISPAIEKLRTLDRADLIGPVPPDALFTARARETYDAAVCMYHDQALIPIKALDVERAVNVTLGLSIVRTSPDHGTALDIAGRGIATPTSLLAAIRLAHEIATLRKGTSARSNG